MPKGLLDRLSSEKRERVVSQAAQLFAERGYSSTDMDELARRAHVSKGSLYNYFENKAELYEYVCNYGLEESRAAVYGGIDPAWSIFDQIDHIFRAGVAFAKDHPEYVSLYLAVGASNKEKLADHLSLETEKPTADLFKRLVRRGQQAGDVRADLDPRVAALFINNAYVMLLAGLVSRHFEIRMKTYLEIDGELTSKHTQQSLEHLLDTIKKFLQPPTTASGLGGSKDEQ